MKKSFLLKYLLCSISSRNVVSLLRAQPVLKVGILLSLALNPLVNSHAQSNPPVNVSGITSSSSQKGSVVTISGDGSLDQAQTWQDSEGYHVVVPNAALRDSVKAGRGIKVRRVGQSIEVVVQTKPGTNVYIERADHRLHLSVEGKLESAGYDSENSGRTDSLPATSDYHTPPAVVSQGSSQLPYQPSFTPRNAGDTGLPTAGRNGFVSSPAQEGPGQAVGKENPATDDDAAVVETDDGFLASVFSGTSVLVVMALGLFGLLVGRKLHSRGISDPKVAKDQETEVVDSEFEDAVPTNFNGEQTGLVRTAGASPTGFARERKSVVRLPVTVPSSLYGAYRIDQEVNKLILGQPHRMDVLSSRAPDDMRAIETSLIKTIASQENDESAQRRAREALEEYGFVARQCASLLLAPDAFERTSAARSLGEVKSPAALPFLLEGLYDHESIVRNQAVISIGELRVPAAIGALLDMARRHPDVPSSLVSRALSACSVEGLDFFDAMVPEPALLSAGYGSNLMHEITHLEPATHVEDLPRSSTDELLAAALVKSESSELEERTQSVKDLAQFQVQEAVLALSRIARCDVEPNVRAHAIASLASINHESVFPAILLGMADESREVRAAAARSLSRLSFDRADAYVRVLETADDELLADVARACLQAGIVGQNIDRLASNDRRQAYEAFAVICVLAKAQMTDSVLEAISSHANTEVRMMAIHLLATTGHPQVFEQFRQLAVQNGISEDVKTALLEAMYKMEQTKSKANEAPEVFWVSNEAEHGQRSDINVADEIVAGADPFESPAPDLATDFEERDLRSSGLQAPGIA